MFLFLLKKKLMELKIIYLAIKFLSYFSMVYVQGAPIGDLLVGHLGKLVLL